VRVTKESCAAKKSTNAEESIAGAISDVLEPDRHRDIASRARVARHRLAWGASSAWMRSSAAMRRTWAWRRAAAEIAIGVSALAGVTAIAVALGLRAATVALFYLIAIDLLALRAGFGALAMLSFVAVGCLNFFFVPPTYTFTLQPIDAVEYRRETGRRRAARGSRGHR